MKNSYSFNNAPIIHMPRNKFDLSHRQLTTATVGRLQPFLVQEVYPGDTFKIDETTISKVSSAFIKPPMSNLWLETYYFFVPNRLIMPEFVNVVGTDADPDSWQTLDNRSVPGVGWSQSQVPDKTVADFMRIPKGQNLSSSQVSVLPFRAFALVYDTWFRNQNVIGKMNIHTGYTRGTQEVINSNVWSINNYMGQCPKVGKYKDLFTTALPSPQKGENINIPLGIEETPIDTTPEPTAFSSAESLKLYMHNEPASDEFWAYGAQGQGSDSMVTEWEYPNVVARQVANSAITSIPEPVFGSNLIVPAMSAGEFTINDLRKAFAMQRQLEKYARVGTRYQEILNGIWGVNSPDARLQRPEYLAGKKTRIQFQQTAQTSAGVEGSPSSNLTAYSNTLNINNVAKSFVEHGFVIGVLTIRQEHLYQQGIEKFWSRSNRTDFYEPTYAHLGEQPVFRREIFAEGAGNDIFGYQEAWYDLRQRQSAVTGEMSSNAQNSLDIWHFGDLYENAPVISKEFIEEIPNFVDRTLAVPSSSQDQFVIDTWFNILAYRRLPIHSIPGLIDHY